MLSNNLFLKNYVFLNPTNGILMGGHHYQVAILVPDDKLDCFVQLENFFLVKNVLAFYPGLTLPPGTDGFSLSFYETSLSFDNRWRNPSVVIAFAIVTETRRII